MAEFERLRAIVDALPRCSDHMEQAIVDDVLPGDSAALASIAISLKRIADALSPDDPRCSPIWRALMEPVNHYGENIGNCIQGQFERSQR